MCTCLKFTCASIVFSTCRHFCSVVLSSCPRCFQVGDPMSYQRESWMMEKDEKLQTVPILHMQGNALVKQRKFREAASKYKEAVLLLKTVQSRVSEWLERKKRHMGRKMSDVQTCVFWALSIFGTCNSCSVPVGDSCFSVLLCFAVSLITGSRMGGCWWLSGWRNTRGRVCTRCFDKKKKKSAKDSFV